jgi:hypothetical protein
LWTIGTTTRVFLKLQESQLSNLRRNQSLKLRALLRHILSGHVTLHTHHPLLAPFDSHCQRWDKSNAPTRTTNVYTEAGPRVDKQGRFFIGAILAYMIRQVAKEDAGGGSRRRRDSVRTGLRYQAAERLFAELLNLGHGERPERRTNLVIVPDDLSTTKAVLQDLVCMSCLFHTDLISLITAFYTNIGPPA